MSVLILYDSSLDDNPSELFFDRYNNSKAPETNHEKKYGGRVLIFFPDSDTFGNLHWLKSVHLSLR